MVIKGKSESGFEFAIDEDVLATHRFRRLVTAVRLGSKNKAYREAAVDSMYMLEELLFGDQAEELDEHLSKVYGHMVTDEEFTSEMGDIIKKVSEASHDVKKS